jgi:hypothetical protein
MGYKSKRKRTKSRNKYSRRRRNRVTKRVSNRGRNRVTRKYKGWGGIGEQYKTPHMRITGKLKNAMFERGKTNAMLEREKKNRQLIGLADKLKNAMFVYNKKNFNPKYLHITESPEIDVSTFITEEDIDIVGPDFEPITGNASQYVLIKHYADRNKRKATIAPPWNDFVGKLCEVPPGFFVINPENNQLPGRNLYDVKNNLANFNQNFPTNANIVEIPTYILGPADQNSRAMNSAGQPIPPGKYKFVLMADNTIRYIPDTGNRNPHYYFPSIMLYFYNIGVITFEELKQSLGNELPHSLLFNPRIEVIMGAGDFTVDQNGYIVELTGYSGHTKPLPSNVALSADRFNNLGYPLIFVRTNKVRLQTGNTDRNDLNNRLIGTYLNVIYERPPDEPLDNAAAVSDEEDEEDVVSDED